MPMKITGGLFLLALGIAANCFLVKHWQPHRANDAILSIVMHLDAVGVESDTYPSIAATLDFEHHTSQCKRLYFNPAYPSSTYYLSAAELDSVHLVLQQADLEKLQATYSLSRTDQPTSTLVIRTVRRTFTIQDYGLEGAAPLPQLYQLVYKLEY
jgi:hypothetical protein